MARWTIYDKNGNVRHTSHTELNNDGETVWTDKIEYSGTWMGESFVTATIKSPYPINFQIGDYIDYRNERYTINYAPTVKKVARRGSYGEAFIYDSIKFNAASDEFTRADFSDFILEGANIHYSCLPSFSFYAESVKDLCDRILANLNRYYTGDNAWTIKILTSELDEHGQNIWYTCGTDQSFSHDIFGGKKNIYISTDNIMCWGAAELIKEKFDLNFFFKGRTLFVGSMGRITPIFKYGKGNGLTEIERVSDSSQQIITRLHAFGSDRNMPLFYYSNLYANVFAHIVNKHYNVGESFFCTLDLDFHSTMFDRQYWYTNSKQVYWCQLRIGNKYLSGIVSPNNHEESLRIMFNAFEGDKLPYVYYDQSTGFNFDTSYNGRVNPGYQFNTVQNMEEFNEAAEIGSAVVWIVRGIGDKDSIPADHKYYNSKMLPDNMAVRRLMLPGFPTQSLSEWASEHTQWFTDNNIDVSKYTFSTDPLDPWVQHNNAETIGVLPATKMFDNDNEKGVIEIYPSIEGMTASDAGTGDANTRLDEVVAADIISDNGKFLEKSTVPNFKIKIPNLGFDLTKYQDKDSSIHMKDGMCGEREFKIVGIVQNQDGTFTCTCNRAEDTGLNLYFPYDATYGVIPLTNAPYQVHTGDHYVILNIELPTEYIQAASRKLLRYAIAYLDENCYTRFNYAPKIDNVWMQRQHDAAIADETHALTSLHDTIVEGDVMDFNDTDLGIDGKIVIDKLVIKEGDSLIPQYDVTLKDEKTVGTMQRVQKQVESISAQLFGNGAGAGYQSEQIKDLIRNYGIDYYISKINDDEASGLINFKNGIKLSDILIDDIFLNKTKEDKTNYLLKLFGGALLKYGLRSDVFQSGMQDGYGFALVERDGKWTLELDDLLVRGKMDIAELSIKKKAFTAGNISLGNAGNKIHRVTPIGENGKETVASVLLVPVKTNGVVTGYTVVAAEQTTSGYNIIADCKDKTNTLLGGSNIVGYKCYFTIDDGSTRITNDWRIGDMAKCRTFNIQIGVYADVANRDYWRVVVETGTEVLEDGKTYAYVVLSNAVNLMCYEDDDNVKRIGRYAGNVNTEAYYCQYDVIRDTGVYYYAEESGYYDDIHWSALNNSQIEKQFYGYADSSSVPAAGDDIVQEGNPLDTSRQGLITLDVSEWSASNPKACKFDMFENIGADTSTRAKQFTLVDANNIDFTNPIHISPKETRFSVDSMKIRTGNSAASVNPYKGTFVPGTSHAYATEEWSYNGSTWVCLTETTSTPSPSNTAWSIKVSKGADGQDGQTFDVKGTVLNFSEVFDELAEHMSNLSPQNGDLIIIESTPESGMTRGSLLYEYNSAHASDISGDWYYGWGNPTEVPVGDAYVVRCLANDDWDSYDSHLFLAIEHNTTGGLEWWSDLGALSGTDGYSINTEPAAVIINELRNDSDIISYDVPKIVSVVANVGGEDRTPTISSISSDCVTAEVVQIDNANTNQIRITAVNSAYIRGGNHGSDTVGSMTVTMTIDGKVFSRTITLNFNRLGSYLIEVKDDTKKELATKTYTYVDGQGKSHTVTAMAGEQIDGGRIKLFVVNKVNGSDVLEETSIELTADGKIDMNASYFVVRNGEGAQTIFEQGKIKTGLLDAEQIVTQGLSAGKVTVTGNIYTPYFRLTENNYNTYTDEHGAIDIAEVGTNIQVEYQPNSRTGFNPNITLPKVIDKPSDTKLLGCELNILNLAKDSNGGLVTLNLSESGIYGGIYRYNNGEELENGNVLIRYGEEFQFKVIYLSNPGKCCWFLTRKNHF